VISPMVAIVMVRLAFDVAPVVLCGAWLFLDWIGTKRLRAMMLVMPDVTAVTRIAPVVTRLAAIAWPAISHVLGPAQHQPRKDLPIQSLLEIWVNRSGRVLPANRALASWYGPT
jgi:hypothetical protein